MNLICRLTTRLRNIVGRSIRSQLVWAFSIASLIIMVATGYALFTYQKDFLYTQSTKSTFDLARTLAFSSGSLVLSNDVVGLQEVLQGTIDATDLKFALVISANGEILASTKSEYIGQFFKDEISQRLLTVDHEPQILLQEPNLIDVAVPIKVRDYLIGWVRVEATRNTVNINLQQIILLGIGAAIFFLLIIVVIATKLAQRLTNGLERLIKAANDAENGREVKRDINRCDEIGSLAVHFYRMLDVIEEEKKAEARLHAFYELDLVGLTITSPEKGWIRVNECLCKMLGYSESDLRNMTWKELTHPDDLAADVEQFEKLMANEINGYSLEKRFISRTGKIIPTNLVVRCVRKNNGEVDYIMAMVEDITDSKQASNEIKMLAFYDPLTGLPNRRLLLDRLTHAIATSARNGKQCALLFLDLDHFKTLNDTLGHDVGDLLLKQVAERLTLCVRGDDTVARLGGDEFVIMLEDLSQNVLEAATQTEDVADKILVQLNQPYNLNNNLHNSTPSIGATLFSGNELLIDDIMKQADIAMYQSKNAGRNTLRFFDPIMQEAISTRVLLENEMSKAIEQQEFQLHYQIQVDYAGKALGAEALIRWIHPEKGMISPLDFITLAEETGLILPIGQWVISTACAQLKKWQEDELTRNLVLSVNVSAKQFQQTDFVTQVITAIENYDINPTRLKLELTESMLVNNINDIISKMTDLNKIGVSFSLDDFGTGYSSLQYLKKLPLHQLKIDQSFVRDIAWDDSDRAIVRTIITMAASLNISVIAEGVETIIQKQFLHDNGCENYQGYFFSKPLSINEFEALLKTDLDCS